MKDQIISISDMQICQGSAESGFWVDLPGWELTSGQRWLVTGESGTGKSTLLEVLGLIKSAQASRQFTFTYAGQSIDVQRLWHTSRQYQLSGIRADNIGFVLQTGGLLPFLNVADNIKLPLRLLGKSLDNAFTAHAIATLKLKPLLFKKPRQLSIGERQRVAFVRAIAHQPGLLLADEPTASLDSVNASRLLDLMLELQQESGICLVLVTHNPELVDWPGQRRLHAVDWQHQGKSGSRFIE
jgi:putative ABC transport system ATP-binding protein